MVCVRRSVAAVAMACAALVLVAAPAAPAAGQDIPLDKEPESNSTLICLGPIGVRVKTDHRVETCADSQSSQGTVKYIFKNSFAEGKLQLEDVIVGVNGQDFNKDFSRKMAAEIDRAEGESGRLVLKIQRGGKPLEVVFNLPKIGSYSSTFPYDCKKSDLILLTACDWLARQQKKDGSLGGIECTAVGGLAFLGSGNPRYAENIARIVKLILAHFKPDKEWPHGITKFGPSGYWPEHGLETWRLNYAAIFLSEYYLASRDSSVLPTMDKLNRNIAFRQFHYVPEKTKKEFEAKGNPLPPYWFSHQFPPDGYGNLGVNVANALVAWELLSECGVPVDRDNFEKTRDYVQVAGPTGEMPYASAPKQRGGDGDAFGRTGVLAVAYHLCNDRDGFNGKIVGALRRLQRNNYFTSHASSDLGKAWGTLGMAGLDPALFREAMDAHKYDYCLVRLSDGSFAANPAVHPQNAGNGDFGNGRVWTTAFNALIFTLPKQRLRITGCPQRGKSKATEKATTAGVTPPRGVVAPAVLAAWQQRFVKKLDALGKAGRTLKLDLGDRQEYLVRGANEQSLIVSAQGNDLPMPWRGLSAGCRAALAKDAATDDDVEALLVAAVLHLAADRSDEAEVFFAKAALKDAKAVKAAKAGLGAATK